jgi:hypothetical protein
MTTREVLALRIQIYGTLFLISHILIMADSETPLRIVRFGLTGDVIREDFNPERASLRE